MGIDKDDVQRIAELAGLDPHPDEMKRLEGELDGILEHMERLAEVSLDESDDGPAERSAPLRADEPRADKLARPVRELAPEWQAGFFTVPRLAALGDVAEGDASGDRDEAGGAER